MIESMKKGSVIVDLAAATGGNTPLTQNNETVIYNGVRIIGDSHLATSMPYDASKMYGKNISNFLQLIINKEGELQLDFSDELIKGACVVTPD
jgi:NAD(P) transhydrogenase subunit alpha